jgi:hypothetical protein
MAPATLAPAAAAAAAGPASPDPRFWDCPELDARLHLANSLGDPLALPEALADALADQWVTDCEPALCRWFARLAHRTYQQVHRDNSYNAENDFDRNFVFSVFAPEDCSDWCWSDDVFVVVETHLGGDVRGNYSGAAVYRVDAPAETGFFDWVVGWYATPVNTASVGYLADCEHPELQAANDRLSIGYSSHPTSELAELLMIGTVPVWSERLGCWVGRLDGVPFPVRLEPVASYYGG